MATVHAIAQQGFGEGTNDLYDRIRPTYQPWTLSHIRKSVQGQAPFNIVEIGAGTGIFTRAILTHPEWSDDIKEIHAVEPSEGMRNTFSDKVEDPRVSVSDGTFDSTGIPTGWADLVTIAQAFHWCSDYGKAAAEFSRILKPGGAVVFVWNLEDRDDAPWAAQLRDTIEVYEQGTPQFRHEYWRQVFKEESYQSAFKPPVEEVRPFHIPGTEDGAVDRASSKSYIAVLPADEKAAVQQRIRDIIKRGDGLEWLDQEKRVFKYPYKVWVVISQKK